jgi:hypothetical protein
MTPISKQFRAVVKEINKDTFTAVVCVSTNSVDRDGDIVEPKSIINRLQSYKNQPVLLSSHRTDNLMRQIGKAVRGPEVIGNSIEVEFQWFVGDGNPEADWGFKLAQKGIAAFSIGFIPYAWEDSKELQSAGVYRKFTDIELLEISQVLVPSNRDAVTARREFAEGMEKEMLELCVKEMKWEEKKPAEVAPEIKALMDKIDALSKTVEELKAPAVKVEDKKHYSEELLSGEGTTKSKPAPTKGELAEMAKQVVNEHKMKGATL